MSQNGFIFPNFRDEQKQIFETTIYIIDVWYAQYMFI